MGSWVCGSGRSWDGYVLRVGSAWLPFQSPMWPSRFDFPNLRISQHPNYPLQMSSKLPALPVWGTCLGEEKGTLSISFVWGHFQAEQVALWWGYPSPTPLSQIWVTAGPCDQSCHLSLCETTLSLWREQRLITHVSSCKLCSQVLSDPQSHPPLRPAGLRQVWLRPLPTEVTAALLESPHGTPLGERLVYW